MRYLFSFVDKKESHYIKIDGEACTHIGKDDYSTLDEVLAACSSYEYCIGFVEKKSECLYEGWHSYGKIGLCFNKGNWPFTNDDGMGKSLGQECVVYKKRLLGKTKMAERLIAPRFCAKYIFWSY